MPKFLKNRASRTGTSNVSGLVPTYCTRPPLVEYSPRHNPTKGQTDVILSRHDLRERDAQGRRRNADRRLYGEALGCGAVSRRGADPSSAGLERILHRDDAAFCPSWLSR